MAMVRVQALKQHHYESIPRHKGEIYEVDEVAVPALTAKKYIRVIGPAETESTDPYNRRDMRPEE
jgi:hypothetical protein